MKENNIDWVLWNDVLPNNFSKVNPVQDLTVFAVPNARLWHHRHLQSVSSCLWSSFIDSKKKSEWLPSVVVDSRCWMYRTWQKTTIYGWMLMEKISWLKEWSKWQCCSDTFTESTDHLTDVHGDTFWISGSSLKVPCFACKDNVEKGCYLALC